MDFLKKYCDVIRGVILGVGFTIAGNEIYDVVGELVGVPLLWDSQFERIGFGLLVGGLTYKLYEFFWDLSVDRILELDADQD